MRAPNYPHTIPPADTTPADGDFSNNHACANEHIYPNNNRHADRDHPLHEQSDFP